MLSVAFFIVMLSVVIQSIIMLKVVMLRVVGPREIIHKYSLQINYNQNNVGSALSLKVNLKYYDHYHDKEPPPIS